MVEKAIRANIDVICGEAGFGDCFEAGIQTDSTNSK